MSSETVEGGAAQSRYAFVRREEAPRLPPPASEVGVFGWLWRNLFASMSNFSTPGAALQSALMLALTVLIAWMGFSILAALLKFALLDAVWIAPEGVKRQACLTAQQNPPGPLPEGWYGACYPYVSAKWKQLVYGAYPGDAIWRVNLVFLIGGLGVAWLVSDAVPRRRWVGAALVAAGVALGLIVSHEQVFGEPFGQRVGVQLLIGVGVMYLLAPADPPKRLVGVLMLSVFPLLAFVLLTGGDLVVGDGFWIVAILGAAAALLFATVARGGLLGPAGAAFSGLASGVGKILLIVLAATFLSSSRFVDIVEAAGGEVISDRERQAISWWETNNLVDAPLLSGALQSAEIDGLSSARAETLAQAIATASPSGWDLDAAEDVVGDMRPPLTDEARDRLMAALSRQANQAPSARDIAELELQTGLSLTEDELRRLNAIDWRERFLGVASAPEDRAVWPLTTVETEFWGGLLVTLVVAIVGIVFSLPLGILLALGRRSSLPAVRILSIVFIEFWRGVPLITILFMSSVMLPFFLPEGTDFDKLMRALIGVMMFSAAYQAEVVRGGFQAIPKGQYEAAEAVGLDYWKSMRLIILPQALTLVIPGIVNTFIGLFKDTTLVLIISIFDLLGAVQSTLSDAEWATPVQASTGYLVAGAIFWIFCFGMSRYSLFMEKQLRKGHSR